MFDAIEKIKQQLTDKYVVVDASVPELARFEGHVGRVKTINMSGRALVQFDAWNNIGWYDIEPGFLKIVPKPEAPLPGKIKETPKAAGKPAAATPAAAGGKKLSPLEMARMQGAAKGKTEAPGGAEKTGPAAGTAKKSTAEILAAARAPKTAAEKPPAKSKPSTADILAAARAGNPAEASHAPATEEPAATQETSPAAAPEPEPPTQEAPPAKQKAQASSEPALPKGERPSVAQILDWCRKHDAK